MAFYPDFASEKVVDTRNSYLTRSYLQMEQAAPAAIPEPVGAISYFRVEGMARFWESAPDQDFDAIMTDTLAGLHKPGTVFVYMLQGDERGVRLYLGISASRSEALLSSLAAAYPFISLSSAPDSTIHLSNCQAGGILLGYPTRKSFGNAPRPQIERICRGMRSGQGIWTYIVLSRAISSFVTGRCLQRATEEMSALSGYLKNSRTEGVGRQITYEKSYFLHQRYMRNLKSMEKNLTAGRAQGMWSTAVYYGASTSAGADRLRSLLVSVYAGEQSQPEPIVALELPRIADFLAPGLSFPHLTLSAEAQADSHPIGSWQLGAENMVFESPLIQRYQTMLHSEHLATFMQLPRKEMPGYYIDPYVEFDTSERQSGNFQLGAIMAEASPSGMKIGSQPIPSHPYRMKVEDFNRHGLILGMTGSGKTNSTMGMLVQLWERKIPFMVIESAKREYFSLMNCMSRDNALSRDMLLFTLGREAAESAIPFRINPFQVIGGGLETVQTHIDYLLATFKASFDLFPPMPQVLEACVYRVYQDLGWDVLENRNVYGMNVYPTLDELYDKVEAVVRELGYDARLRSDIMAAVQTRIHSLRLGSKGALLNNRVSTPIGELLQRPVVLELDDIGDDDVKSFVIAILLIQIYEYRKSRLHNQLNGSVLFEHLLVIEEAHRLLANSPSGGEGGNPRAQAIQFFSNLLAEIRSGGQGFLISDQMPSKLTPDTLRNTNLKLVHRITTEEDRELIGGSMSMTEEQIAYISNLKLGQAAIFSEGDSRPKLVQMPLLERVPRKEYKTRTEAVQLLRERSEKLLPASDARNHCPFCDIDCQGVLVRKLVEHRKWHIQLARKWSADPEQLWGTDVDTVCRRLNLFISFLQKHRHTEPLSGPRRYCVIKSLLALSGIGDELRSNAILNYGKKYVSLPAEG